MEEMTSTPSESEPTCRVLLVEDDSREGVDAASDYDPVNELVEGSGAVGALAGIWWGTSRENAA